MIARNPQASYAFYDGEVKATGEAVHYGEPIGRLAEVKTGGQYWTKVLNDEVYSQLTSNNIEAITQTLRELNYQINVALFCQCQSFISFSNQAAAEAAQQVFAQKTKLLGVVHLIDILNQRLSLLPPDEGFNENTAIKMLQPNSELNVLVYRWNGVHYMPDF